MAITIVQQPQALTLVGVIPDIIVETTGLGMVLNLKIGSTVLLSEYYTPDASGRSRVNLRDFIDEQLSVDIPGDVDLYEQTNSWKAFTVELIVGVETTDFSFIAIKGGSSKLTLECASFLRDAWLTWQVQTKYVRDVDPEWISYYAQYASLVKCRAYFSGGTSETITLHTLEAGKHYTINATFSDIREEFVDQPVYFDLWVENSGGTAFTTWQMRYVLTTEEFDYDDLFLFKNGLGGIDTIRFSGEKRAVNPMEVAAALFYDEYEIDYQVTPKLAFEKNTGYFPSREAMLWAQDFFLNKYRYVYEEEELVPIRLISPETLTQDWVLVSYEFTYGYTRQTLYLSLFKKKSPLIDPVIIGPGDEEFYLPPDIAEFPQQTDPSGLLFPVQKPGTPGWFFITWENMLAEILENLPAGEHNELTGIQGGQTDQYFHLTEEEHEKVLALQDPAPQGDRVVVQGTLVFDSATAISGENWSAVVGGNEYEDFDILIDPIEGTPADWSRRDIVVIDPDGDVSYIAGTEFSEGIIQPPTPAGSLLLAFIDRSPDGDNTIYLTAEDLTDYVSKSFEGHQQVKSSFGSETLKGSIQDLIGTDANGRLRKLPPARAGVYTTLEGDGGFTSGWSRVLRITIDPVLQINYVITFQVLGVTPTYEKGDMWVVFRVDSGGDIITNSLQLFGSFLPERYKLIKVDSDHYELYVSHDLVDSLYSFRPIMLFGNDWRYEFFQQDPIVENLPAGDQYDFISHIDPLDPAIVDGLNASLVDTPGPSNKYITVSYLNSYAYVQEAPINGNHYARKDGAWVAFTPFTVAGTPTAGHVVTSVAGVPTWAAPSGGGNFIAYDVAQGLTASQMQQGRDNIGLDTGFVQSVDTNLNNLDIVRTSNLIYLTTLAFVRTIRSLGVGRPGERVTIVNKRSVNATILNTNTSAGQFSIGANYNIIPNERLTFAYDEILDRWVSESSIIGGFLRKTVAETIAFPLTIATHPSSTESIQQFTVQSTDGIEYFRIRGRGVMRHNVSAGTGDRIVWSYGGSVDGSIFKYTASQIWEHNSVIYFTNDDVRLTNLPTTDPAVAGRLWNDSGTAKISAG